jgi:hypothetical protein
VAGNLTLAQTVATDCDVAGVRLGFVSSGFIYTGVKVRRACGTWAAKDRLTEPLISELLEKRSDRVKGFSEEDEPNFTFSLSNCIFYRVTKALAEDVMKVFPDFYVWREHQMGLDRLTILWTVLMYRQWHQRVMGK